MSATLYCDADFPDLADFMAANARDRFPAAPILLPGDLAWRLPSSEPEQNLRIYRRDEHQQSPVVGFAWFEPLTGLDFDIKAQLPEATQLADDIFSWAEARRLTFAPAFPRFVLINDMAAWRREIEQPEPAAEESGHHLTTIAMESDQTRIEWIRSRGYKPTDHHAPVYFWDLTQPLPDPSPPPGCLLRSVTNSDEEERVAVHRAAWVGSSFDARRYREMRSRSVYDQQFDIVLEKDGAFGAYCICWADPVCGIGHFEPVGTRESFRGQGAAQAVIMEGLRRLKAAGMQIARVSTAGFNAPAQALYESCGFLRVDVERTFIRQVG